MAASLSADQIREVTKQSKEDGRALLQSFLDWPQFDEEEEPQKAIHLDCVYDCLTFMSQRGLAWTHISKLLVLLQDLLAEFPGKTLPETVKLYHFKMNNLHDQLNEAAMKLFTEYFFSSFLRHFKLYQFVFTRDQEVMRTVQDLEVYVPENPLPFKEGRDIKLYEYEQKYNALDLQLTQKQEEHEKSAQESKNIQQQRLSSSLENLEEIETPLEREKLLAVINQIASSHVSAAASDLKTEIDYTMSELNLMLEKTALPRPSGLGPPPRYKTKTPVQNLSGKRPANSRETLKSRGASSRPGKK